jgi:micrococcal nuclease
MRLSRLPLPSALVVIALTAGACGGDVTVNEAGEPRAITPTPYVRPGLVPALVTRVVDGDTIRVEIEGTEYRLRYIGIDTPETVDPRRPIQCFGKEASERNRQLVEGQTVGLEKDISETDDFDRLLRYVWVGDLMVNATLVEEGYALASTYPPDVRYSEQFAAVQSQAREASRGLWGSECSGSTAAP